MPQGSLTNLTNLPLYRNIPTNTSQASQPQVTFRESVTSTEQKSKSGHANKIFNSLPASQRSSVAYQNDQSFGLFQDEVSQQRCSRNAFYQTSY